MCDIKYFNYKIISNDAKKTLNVEANINNCSCVRLAAVSMRFPRVESLYIIIYREVLEIN